MHALLGYELPKMTCVSPFSPYPLNAERTRAVEVRPVR